MKKIVIQAKSKYPKSETEPYNPWAVCNKSTGGKKEDPDKFERCVHHLKDQNREKNRGKKKKASQYGDVWLDVLNTQSSQSKRIIVAAEKKKKD